MTLSLLPYRSTGSRCDAASVANVFPRRYSSAAAQASGVSYVTNPYPGKQLHSRHVPKPENIIEKCCGLKCSGRFWTYKRLLPEDTVVIGAETVTDAGPAWLCVGGAAWPKWPSCACANCILFL